MTSFVRLEEDQALELEIKGGVKWGDESKLFTPPEGVTADASWLSVMLFYIFLFPLNLIMIVIGGFSDGVYRCFANGGFTSHKCGRPLCLAFWWWWYQPAGAIRLIRCGSSRFAFFNMSQKLFGGGDFWWHGEGVWSWRYDKVLATMKSDQKRTRAFGAVRVACPEVFPTRLLLFESGSSWAAVRAGIQKHMTNPSVWAGRRSGLQAAIAAHAPSEMSAATLTKADCDKMAAAGVWWLVFGKTLSDEQVVTIAAWGASGGAGSFIFPRLIQRIAFNALARKTQDLRLASLDIFKQQGLQPLAETINSELPAEYQVDELMYLAEVLIFSACFAGVGGTQHGTWATAQFLVGKTVDVPQESVAFPDAASLVAAYKRDPAAFIKEAVRLDAPVTSATCAFEEETEVPLKLSCCCGDVKPTSIPKDTLHQYVLSMANRDEAKWGPTANTFDPSRADLEDMVGWNGPLSDRASAPRFCPGHDISMEVIAAVTGLLKEVQ